MVHIFEALAFRNTLKLHRWQKLRILQLKNQQIWCKLLLELTRNNIMSTTSCQKRWNSPGAKSQNLRERVYVGTYTYDSWLKS